MSTTSNDTPFPARRQPGHGRSARDGRLFHELQAVFAGMRARRPEMSDDEFRQDAYGFFTASMNKARAVNAIREQRRNLSQDDLSAIGRIIFHIFLSCYRRHHG